jgi:hypothetical protein
MPAKECVKEFDIERFLILRQAQDEEMDGIFPLILSTGINEVYADVEGCGRRFDTATDSFTGSKAGIQPYPGSGLSLSRG